MYAIISVNIPKLSLILTKYSNIDWELKEVVRSEDIIEHIYNCNDIIKVFDISNKKVRNIRTTEVKKDIHRILIDKNIYVILNKLIFM